LGKKILIIDDERDILEFLKMVFESEGFEVDIMDSGEKSLDFINKGNKFDLIHIDVMMGGMDGNEVCRRLKGNNNTKDTLVYMLSAKVFDHEIQESYQAGADGYITKPFEINDLVSKIKEILSK
jgi:DNA-binding response OmpR family regulator